MVRTNLKRETFFLLLLGVILLGFTGMRWNLPLFAWVCLVPFLRLIRIGSSNLLLYLSLCFILVASTFRIVSEPYHVFIALSSGIQGGIVFGTVIIFYNWTRKETKDSILSPICFSFICMSLEWLGGITSEFGVWGMMANSQIPNLNLLQSVSLFGATGLGFFIYFSNFLIERIWFEFETFKKVSKWTFNVSAIFLLIILFLYIYGVTRLSLPIEGSVQKFGTITSHTNVEDMWKDKKRNQTNTETVLERTRLAARQGAKLVVWNEGGILIQPENEGLLIQKIKQIALEEKVEILAAIIVEVTSGRFYFDNKIVWISKEGNIRQTYFKKFPAPGEPISKQESEIQVLKTELGNLAVAICYDFDSLSVAKAHADLGAGVSLIAASDWSGIDPFHTEMAMIRGIENGTSIVRSTRQGVSAMFDAYGRIRGRLEYNEPTDGVLVASIPTKPLNTIYRRFGNWMVFVGVLFWTFFLVWIYWEKRSKHFLR